MRGACDCVMGEQMQDEGWEFVGRGGGERKRYRYDGIFRDQGSGGARGSQAGRKSDGRDLPSAGRKTPGGRPGEGGDKPKRKRKEKYIRHHSKPYWTAILHAS